MSIEKSIVQLMWPPEEGDEHVADTEGEPDDGRVAVEGDGVAVVRRDDHQGVLLPALRTQYLQ